MRAATTIGLAVALAVCGDHSRVAAPTRAAADRGALPQAWSAFDAQVRQARARGNTGQALEAARARARAGEAAGASWRREDADRELKTLVRVATLSESLRTEWAGADRATGWADSLEREGRGLEAMRLIERQLGVRERAFGAAHPEAVASRAALARIALSQGQPARALELGRLALEQRRRALGPRHPDVAESMAHIANVWKASSATWSRALAYQREALAIRLARLEPGAPEIAEGWMGVGNMHRVMHHPDSALAAFHEALALRRRMAPRSDPVASTLTAMALVHTQDGRWREAEPLLREAVAIRAAPGRPRNEAQALSTGTLGITLRHLGRLAEAESLIAECVALRETHRALALPEGRAVRFDLRDHWHLAAVQLERGAGVAAWVSVERGLSRALIEDLAQRHAIDTVGLWRRPLARVQRALRRDRALVGWLEVLRGAGFEEWPFWCYVVRDHGPPRWHRVDAPPGATANGSTVGLHRLRRHIRGAATWPLQVRGAADARRQGRDLHRLRFAPLEADLAGVRELIVVSPDILHGVPLEALIDEGGRWLGDRFDISYTPSALWTALRGGGDRDARDLRRKVLLVGDPAYAAVPGGGRSWPRIASARSEIEHLAAILPGSRLLRGAGASESMLHGLSAADSLADYGWIHFAAHSAIDETWPGRSAIVLADAGASSGGEGPAAALDGWLTADEISHQWRLDANLVSLAACRSALGPMSSVEGYLGLNRALLAAGARCLLVSLWPVDDRATALLMTEFYRRLSIGGRGSPPASPSMAAALGDAQRLVRTWRTAEGIAPYEHPAYWAGFVLLGNATTPR